jgi:hypothetical protein
MVATSKVSKAGRGAVGCARSETDKLSSVAMLVCFIQFLPMAKRDTAILSLAADARRETIRLD